MAKVLLYSGGTDSWLINEIWKPDVKLYIDIHGRYSKQEIERLPEDVIIVDFPFLGTIEREDAIVPLRNLYFIMIASNYGNEICLGATKSDRGGKDKRPYFFKQTQNIINYCLNGNSYGSSGKVKICDTFYKKTKVQLLEMYLNQGGSIDRFVNETFSCYTPCNDSECFQCKPCYRKFLLAYNFGYRYSEDAKLKTIEYLESEVIPGKVGGTYFTQRGDEGKLDEKAVDKLFREYNLDWRLFK